MDLNNKFLAVQGTAVVVREATTISNAHTVLKSKKATDVDKQNALELIRRVYNCDDGIYYSKFLAYTNDCNVDALASNIIGKAIYEQGKLPTVTEYMRMLPDYARIILANRARQRIKALYNYNIDDDKLTEMQKNETLLLYEYLCYGVGVCVTHGTNKAGEPTVSRTYITRNPQVLYALAVRGYIKDVLAQDAQSWVTAKLDNIFSKSAEKQLNEGKTVVMCLKPESDGTAVPKYTVTKRQAPVTLSGEEGVQIYPIETYKVFADLTTNLLRTGVYNVDYKKLDGTIKQTVVTLSTEAVKYCYEEVDSTAYNYANLFTQAGLVGWRPAYFGLNAFSLLKDKFTTFGLAVDTFEGIAAYDPTDRNNVHFEALRRTAENYRDVVAARMVFNTVVSRMRKEYFELFEPYVSNLREVQLCKDKRTLLLRWAVDVSDEDLYELLDKAEFSVILQSSLKERCKARRRTMPTFLKKFTALNAVQDYNLLTESLRTGVVQVAYITSSGNLQVLNLTNNATVLRKMYGDNYIVVWETPAVRLKVAIAEVKAAAGTDTFKHGPAQIDLLRKYDLFATVFSDGDCDVEFVSDADFVHFLETRLEFLQERRKSRIPDGAPTFITARVADGVGLDNKAATLSFYRTLYLNRIISASYSPLKASK